MSRAGILKDRLQFMELVENKNEYLEQESNWQEAFVARGNLKHSGGSKSEQHDERFQGILKTYTIRDQWPVDSSMRVIIDGNIFEIVDIEPAKYQSKFLNLKLSRIND